VDQLKHAVAFVRERSVNLQKRSVDAVVSDETIDAYGEIVDSASWKLERYLRNPVVLHQHDHSAPMGRAESVRVEGGALCASIVFANTDLGNELLQLYSEGALRAFSVGFRPGRVTTETVNGRTVERLLDCELLEISCVSVPANPNAVARHKALGLVPPSYSGSASRSIHEEALADVERRSRMSDEERVNEDVDRALSRTFGAPFKNGELVGEYEEPRGGASQRIHEEALEHARRSADMTEGERTEHDFNEAVQRHMRGGLR
jgi:HK97 family phage prohead protease